MTDGRSPLPSPLAAVAFLTRLPIRGSAPHDPAALARSTVYFPLVGAGIGAAQAAVASLLAGLPHALAAVLVVAAGAFVTGALHLDGLADTADGLGGGRTRDDALRIMRDHAVGAYGAVALVLVLALEVAAIAPLVGSHRVWPAFVIAGAVSRWAPLPLGAALPYARAEGGLGDAVTGRGSAARAVIATVLNAVICRLTFGGYGLVVFAGAAMLVAAAGVYLRRRLGGVTGDTHGAVIVIVEALALAAFC